MKTRILFCLFCLLPALALADKEPEGLVSLQTTATESVETDTLIAQIAIEEEHLNPETLANTINQKMAWAQMLIAQQSDVQLIGGLYNSYPVYDKRIFRHWRGSQQFTLKSQNSVALGKLIGQLQEKLLVKSLSYEVSDTRVQSTQDALIREAIRSFQARAELVRDALRAKSYRIHQMDVNTNQHARPMLMRSSMMADSMESKSMTPATLNPGEETIQVTVNGRIQMIFD